jgi:hypothetical protein
LGRLLLTAALLSPLFANTTEINYRTICNLEKVPSGTALQRTHPLDFYRFPEKIPEKYTGCVHMWLPDGEKMYSAYYVGGTLVWSRGHEPGGEEQEIFYKSAVPLTKTSMQ